MDVYAYDDAEHTHAHAYLSKHVLALVDALKPKRIIDLGCGNGSLTALLGRSCEAIGVDTSESGIAFAQKTYPGVAFKVRSIYEPLEEEFGTFDVVVSTEVIEHLIDPRRFLAVSNGLLEVGGHIVLSTPYHGYFKNLALALTGKLDSHFTALWDGGHIKFFSIKTLSRMLEEKGFIVEKVLRVGRVATLAKSMIFVARKVRGA